MEVGGGGASVGCCYFSMPCNSVGFVVLDLMSFLVDGCFGVYLFLFFPCVCFCWCFDVCECVGYRCGLVVLGWDMWALSFGGWFHIGCLWWVGVVGSWFN